MSTQSVGMLNGFLLGTEMEGEKPLEPLTIAALSY